MSPVPLPVPQAGTGAQVQLAPARPDGIGSAKGAPVAATGPLLVTVNE